MSRSLYHHTGLVPEIEVSPERVRFTIRSPRVMATGSWVDVEGEWKWRDPELYVDDVRCAPAATHQELGEIVRDPDAWKDGHPYVEPELVPLDRSCFVRDIADLPAAGQRLAEQFVKRGMLTKVGVVDEGGNWVMIIDAPKGSIRLELHAQHGMPVRMWSQLQGEDAKEIDLRRANEVIRKITGYRPVPAGHVPDGVHDRGTVVTARGVEIRKGEMRRT
ncbi:MAG TPA: hypothetical protein VIU37_05360 [Candidatus Limnocylindrales bacterium]